MQALFSLSPPPRGQGARPRISLVLLLVTSLIAGLLTALTATVGAAPAHAATVDRTVLAWNMQGGGTGRNPAAKWEDLKNPLMSQPGSAQADIALLQEAGPTEVPASAKHKETLTPKVLHGEAEPINQVEHRTWKVSTQRNYHIYRIDWDSGGHRVNLAIVTREEATETVLVGRVSDRLRPMLGVRIGNDVYFTLHASASGGGDAMSQARRAWAWAQDEGYTIMVGGDFNREPDQLGDLNGLTLNNTGKKTHVDKNGVKRELDYALVGDPHGRDSMLPERIDEPGRYSDHTPVLLISHQACAWRAANTARASGAPSQAAQAADAEQCQDAVVSMGDSYISGEAGRWQGNGSSGQYSTKARQGSSYGTDRAAFDCTGSGSAEKCEHDPKRVYGETAEGNERCHRSDVAPIKSLGDALGIPRERRFNIACSGATTEDVTSRSFKGEEPQVEQLAKLTSRYRVTYVVLSVGGNDLGFSEIAQNCVLGYEANRPCSAKGREEVVRKYGAVREAVSTTVEAVRETLNRSGQRNARIILQGYPNPVPSALNVRYENRMWMREMAGGCPLTDQDIDWLHYEVVPGLNQHLADVAGMHKVIFLDTQSAFAGHQLCGQGADQAGKDNTLDNPPDARVTEWVRWIPGLADGLPWTQGETQEAAHPNAYGQQALGTCLRKTMEALPNLAHARYFACYGAPGMGPDQVRIHEKHPSATLLEGETHSIVLRNATSGDLVEADWGGNGAYVRGEEERDTGKQRWDFTASRPAGPTVEQHSDQPQPVLADVTVKYADSFLSHSEDGRWAQLAKGGRDGVTTWALSLPDHRAAVQYFYLREHDGKRKVAGCLTQNPQTMTDTDRKSWLTVEPCGERSNQWWWLEPPGQLPGPRLKPRGWDDQSGGTTPGPITSDQLGTCLDGNGPGPGGARMMPCSPGAADQQWRATPPSTTPPAKAAGTTATGTPAKTAARARTHTPPTPTAGGAFFLVNPASDKCLRYDAAEHEVALGPCAQSRDQQWAWQGRTLRSVDSGQCLKPGLFGTVGLTDCVTVPDALKGGIAPKDADRVALRSATGLAMELPGGDTTAGAKITGAAPAPGQNRQMWDLHADTGPDGIWRLAPRLTGSRHLSYNVIDKVAALMDAVADNKGEQWRLEPIGGGWYRVVNNLDGTVLTATRSGEPLALRKRANNLGQWWRFDAA
ncbi:endonuclease/exonuclease/phosphatase family protein [Streptomyces sp. JJ66]|uniref:GDSL-type esterase/lipase family protein n=1 Tax=Streptomyces sp. JJ66 TaxID=2803843 RepID=UPI001C582409|nr:GDSL-type esterase/lipase family protein [Streptomyces sp. JJ66]MBW1603360.1 endonuclease/exonuclease/phosphatase family protein [Streptomyces sp. JJ66]